MDALVEDLAAHCACCLPAESVSIRLAPLAGQPRYVVRQLLIAVWREQGWPLQSMGFGEWDLLARNGAPLPCPVFRETAQEEFPRECLGTVKRGPTSTRTNSAPVSARRGIVNEAAPLALPPHSALGRAAWGRYALGCPAGKRRLRTAKGITGGFSHPSPCPLPVGERVQRTVIPFAVLRPQYIRQMPTARESQHHLLSCPQGAFQSPRTSAAGPLHEWLPSPHSPANRANRPRNCSLLVRLRSGNGS